MAKASGCAQNICGSNPPAPKCEAMAGPKTIVTGKEQVKIAGLEPVGNYAVRITFDDGHDSGLYSWDYLHKLGAQEQEIWATYLAASNG
jgi:DUF971 family protein